MRIAGRQVLTTILLAPALLVICSVTAAAQAVLQGRVTDRSTGTALSGVIVQTGCQSSITDANGSYALSLEEVCNSTTGSLTLRAAGHFIVETAFSVTAAPTTMDVSLAPGGPLLQGTVTDAVTHDGIPGAGVFICASNTVRAPQDGSCAGVFTTADGRYTFESSTFLEAAADGFDVTHVVLAQSAYFGQEQFNGGARLFRVTAPFPSTRDFSLIPASGVVLQGTITDRNNAEPIAGAIVETGCRSTLTDAGGKYSFIAEGVCNSTTGSLTVRAAGHFIVETAFSVAAPPTTMDLSLAPGGTLLQGTVTDAVTHDAIAGAGVFICVSNTVRAPQDGSCVSAFTTADGRYAFESSMFLEGAANGFDVTHVVLSQSAYFGQELFNGGVPLFQVTAPLPSTRDFSLIPASGVVLQGTVTNRNNAAEPIAGAIVETGCRSTLTDGGGRYSLTAEGVCNSTTGSLTVRTAGYFVTQTSFTILTAPTTTDVSLAPGGTLLRGTVTDAVTHDGIAGAGVFICVSTTVRAPQDGSCVSAFTTADGRYAFESSMFLEEAANGFDVTHVVLSQSAYFGQELFNGGAPVFRVAAPFPSTRDFTLSMTGPVSRTAIVSTQPPGLAITVDGAATIAPQTYTWYAGAPHTVAATSAQPGTTGTRYLFSSWSDGGTLTHTIIAGSTDASYTANFTTQYALTTGTSPAAGGSVTASGWRDAGSTVTLAATAATGYRFNHFSGDVNATSNLFTFTIDGPTSVIANFVPDVVTLASDGTLTELGGTVSDDAFGTVAQMTASPGIVSGPTSVAIDVLTSPPVITLPAGYLAAGTYFVRFELTPTPSLPLAAPGLTLVLPLIKPLAAGTRLDLERVDPATSTLVPSLDTFGNPIRGTVDPGELSATFAGVVHLSTVVGLIPSTGQGAAATFSQVSAGLYHNCAVHTDGSVVCWGLDTVGQATPPAGTFTQVSAGYFHTCGIKSDGTVACWGDNGEGQATPPAGTFSQVSGGDQYTCGVQGDGTVACWGLNNFGQATPPAGTFIQVSAGAIHTCAIQIDGTIVCWGLNHAGQATNPAGTFIQVDAAANNTCAVMSDGTVACWGQDQYGQATAPTGTFTQVSAAYAHTCGVKTGGSVVCWGYDFFGQATPPAGPFTQVSAGLNHTCGVKTDATIACWGDNSYGQATPPSSASQIITVSQAPPPTAAFNTAFSVSATASSGLPVAIAALGACSIAAGTVTMTSGSGICMVTFDQAGNASYAAAPQIARTTIAELATPTVSVTGGTFAFDGAPHGAIGFAYGVNGFNDLLAPPTFSYVGTGGTVYGPTPTPPTAVGTYNAVGFFAGTGNYAAAANSAAITIYAATPAAAQTLAYVANQFPDTLSVIDTSTRTVIRTIPLHQPPDIAGDVALTPDGRFLYVTDPGGSVLVLDAATYARVAMIPLGTNLDARDIVISPDGAWAYVVQKNTNNVSVIDTASRAVVAVVDVGTLPTRIAFSPDGRFAYVTNSLSNDVSVIETATRTVVGAIRVDSFPNDIAVVTVGGAVRAYVTAWAASAVSVLDLSSNTLVGRIPLEGAWTIEASRDGSFVAVAQWSLATKGLTIIDTATNTVRSTLAVPVEQANIKLTPDDAFAYLTDFSGNLGPGDSVFVVDLTANAIVSEVPVGITPFGMAIGTPAVSAAPPIGGACSIVSASAATFAIGAAGTFSVVTVGCPVGTNIRIVGQPPPGTPVAGLTFTNNGDGTATLSGTPEAGTAGVYSILIAATNGASPDAVQSFTLTIDTPVVVTAPDTTLTLYPPPLSFSHAATFRFESNTPGVFACSLDGSAFTPCTSPQNYLGLANGTHSFAVQATDLFNTSDPTAATYSWTIDVAADYEVLKYFGQRGQDLSDGGLPESTVTLGSDGFLYGTTVAGRDAPCSPSVLHGCYNAPVYKIDAAGNFFVLDRFEAFAEPSAQLIRARDGSFYGTDAAGPLGYGSVFKVDATGHLIKLHTFDPFTEGRPIFGVTEAADGYFYGTTIGSPVGPPTLFRFDSAGQLTVLHVFDPTEGTPSGRLIQGPDGELYGTTSGGSGGGTIFRSTTSGDVTVLHVFDPGATVLSGGLLLASDGYFYGQTLQGSIFKIAADGTFSVVHELGAINNSVPGALIQATDGNLYGTTSGGGQFGGGTVFRMDLNGNVTILHSFGSDGDGLFVLPGVVQGSDGALYGTTQAGRGLLGAGTIFRLSLTAGPAASDLLVSPATGSVGGTTTLSAALSSSGAPIAGRVVSFTLNGIAVGAASTDDAGGASLTGVRLAGVFAGSYPNAIQASFGGDASFAAATGSADLLVLDVVTPALPTIVVTSPSEPIYELGSVVTVLYTCTDAETCTGDVANGAALDTSTPGPHSFTITATSFGNVTTERVAYTVSFGTAVPPFAGLTAWLPGDGAATDEVTGTDATWTGTPAYATGKVAQAFAVAAGNAVTLPFTQTGPFTLQAWVRTPNRLQPEFAGIVSSGGPGQAASTFQLELDGFGNYRLNAGSGDLSILIGPATDVFQHLAVTFDGATIVTYLNGQIVESAAWLGSPDLGFTTLAIGVDREAVSPFEGFVDEVQVFNRALSDVEVLQTFEAGASGLQKNRAPIAAAAAAPNPAEAAGLDGATVAFDASASIDPDGDALTYLWQEGPATLGSARTISALLSIGTHIVTLTVDDGHHHTVSVDVRVVVQDTTAPVMSNVAADVVAEATSASGAVVTFGSPTAADLVDSSVAVTCGPASGSIFALGPTPVTCTATDAHANTATATFLVTVVDTTGPVLTLPPPIVAEATSPAGAVVTFTATALDAVTGPATVMCLPAAGSTFPTGLNVVTCTATDATGHATTGGFQVLVGDTTAPVAQIVSPSPDALITASATDVIVQVADALGVASVAVNGVAATLFAGTPQAGTWRATVPVSGGRSLPIGVTASDAARNSGTASRVVDNDGIPSIAPAALDRGRTNGIDQSALSSNDFNNGVTSGTLVRNGWTARLSNAPTVNGVRVQVTGAGTAPARVLACIGAAKEVRLDVVGETADITCDPATGTITAKAVSAVAKIEVWKQTSPTTWTVAQLPTGAIYSTGSPATADRGNPSSITVDVVQIDAAGAPLVVGSFDLAPGASVDVTTAPGASRGSEQLHFHVLRGVVPFRLGARTRTLKPGDLTVLPIENRRQ